MQRARTDDEKEERRGALLAAALDEFGERGFAAARMDDIAKRAGLSKGALYLYFPSKDALFGALIDSFAETEVERVEALLAAAPSAEAALASVQRIAPRLIRETPVPRFAKLIIGDASVSPALIAAYRARILNRVEALVAGVFERGRRDGAFREVDTVAAARCFMSPFLFAAVWTVVFEPHALAEGAPPLDVDALFAHHVAVTLNGVRKPSGDPV